jgi:uncharacterized protein (TIGR03083 family)
MADMWTTIAAERGALAQDLDRLTDDQWGTRSLCESWTVEDVVAHMTSTAQMTPAKFFGGFMVSGFNFPRFAEDGIKTHRGDDPLETLANFRKQQSSRKSPPGPKVTWLGETIIHAEDARRPLGIVHEYPIDAVREVMDFYKNSDTLIRAKSRIAGLTLRATDTDWTHGDGPLVEGRLIDLLLAATGREAALDRLSGDGVETFRQHWTHTG